MFKQVREIKKHINALKPVQKWKRKRAKEREIKKARSFSVGTQDQIDHISVKTSVL